MASLNIVLYDCFPVDMGLKAHELDSDTLKIAFTNTAPNVATHLTLADISEITPEHGYSAGGATMAATLSSVAGGAYFTADAAVTFTATGGSFGPFRYAVLYNSSASDKLIGYWDFGTSITVTTGLTFQVDATGGIANFPST